MNETQAIEWLRQKGWHVTDLRVEALVAGIDLEHECGACTAWSDGGPCATCIINAIDAKVPNPDRDARRGREMVN